MTITHVSHQPPIMSLKVFLVLALATCVLAQPKEDEDTFCEEDNCYEGA